MNFFILDLQLVAKSGFSCPILEPVADTSQPVEIFMGISQPLLIFLKPKVIELTEEIQIFQEVIFGTKI